MKRLLPLLIFSSIITHHLQAQSTCAQTLRTARSTYDQGRLHELPVLLQACLVNGFSDQEKVEAYKLLALAYIYLEEPTKADEAMLNLLQTDSYFEINNTTDPAEFISLYKTFRTWPIYRVGAKIGVNASLPNTISRVNAVDGSQAEYSPNINFQSGVAFEIPLGKKIILNPELYFQLRSFLYTNNVALQNDVENTTEGREKGTWISVPVSVQYLLNEKRFHPYVALGVSADYLMNAEITLNRTRENATSVQQQTFTLSPQRNAFNLGLVASAGSKVKVGGGYITGELRFLYGLTAVNDESTAFTIDNNVLFDYGYADNYFKLNSISITFGYVYNVFSPKKLRNKK
ncbi:MAG: PorT family protein [Cyclobacteriaceae bacterium]|nr:PorT family protein [Cyclobacteriaceae bacterium]